MDERMSLRLWLDQYMRNFENESPRLTQKGEVLWLRKSS